MIGNFVNKFYDWQNVIAITVLIMFLRNDFCRCQNVAKTCDADYRPENCDLPDLPLSSLTTIEAIERCVPAILPVNVRNYLWAASGRQITVNRNKSAFKKIIVYNRVLRDVSNPSLSMDIFGQRMSFPVGIAPTAGHRLVHKDGETATARAAATMDTIMVLTMFSTTTVEDLADNFRDTSGHLWMQIFLFEDRQQTVDIVQRAERAGFEAIVVTVDSTFFPKSFCPSRNLYRNQFPYILFNGTARTQSPSATFEDLRWLCGITKLPVVVKGILSAEDAILSARAGAAGILVSNHGGRQLDSTPATIDALSAVTAALRRSHPTVEVLMDGGVRNGNDVFKALLRGARVVFVGRPIIWGLAAGGEEGVRKVLDILRSEFNETMLVAGYANPQEIYETATRNLLEGYPLK